MKLLIQTLSDKIGTEIPLPYYATDGAAALDLAACIDEDITLPAGERVLIPTGIAVAIPDGYVGILAVRSSMGIKHGVTLTNGIGVIDSDYRGELRVGLHNTTSESFTIHAADRIAQLMVVPVATPAVEIVTALPPTARGMGGIGSTGQ